MAELAGYLNEIYILSGTSAMTDSTGAKVLGVDNSTFKKLCNILDISQFGDEYHKRLAGMKDTEISFSGNYYSSDATGQAVLVPGASVYIGVYPSGSGSVGTQVPCIVESFETSAPIDGKQTFTAGIATNGAPVSLPAQA